MIEVKDGPPGARHVPGVDDEIGYHSTRALAELDSARRCLDVHAARSHLQLAEQHLERMRALCGAAAASDPTPPGLA